MISKRPHTSEMDAIISSNMDQNIVQPESDENKAKQEQEEQMRRDLLATLLDPAARERLCRIALVSFERSKQIETILLRTAQTGQLRGRVSEPQLIDLLDQMEDAQGKAGAKGSTTIVYRRKHTGIDDDDFDI